MGRESFGESKEGAVPGQERPGLVEQTHSGAYPNNLPEFGKNYMGLLRFVSTISLLQILVVPLGRLVSTWGKGTNVAPLYQY